MSASFAPRRTLAALALLVPTLAAPSLARASLSCGLPSLVGDEVVQQPFYDVSVDAATGAYTAGTGASHGVTLGSGNSQNVLYGGQTDDPSTSSFGVFF